MGLSDWISVAVGVLALASPLVTWGIVQQKVTGLKEDVGRLATKESVQALDGRVGELETDMREARQALVTIPELSAKMDGMKELVTVQLDELKHGMREVRSFFPPENRSAPRKRPTSA